MDSARSSGGLTPHKLLIAGGFAVGKTTMVAAISEVRPLLTEEKLTTASVGHDDLQGVPGKTTTTVALDYGRITFANELVLYLFGVPGQERFWFMWDELSHGAIGAVVLADTRRLEDCFPAVDFFESRGIGFAIAVNQFDNAFRYDERAIRTALDLKPSIPVLFCDARDRGSATGVLASLIKHLIDNPAQRIS